MLKTTLISMFIFVAMSGVANAMPAEADYRKNEKLFFDSVEAKRIINSDNKKSKIRRNSAIKLLKRSKAAAKYGDGEKADKLLSNAKKTFFSAFKMVKNNAAPVKKDLQKFNIRKDNVSVAKTMPSETDYQSKQRLLFSSSAARRIINSDNAESKVRRMNAVKLFEKSKIAAKDGNGKKAGELLGKATTVFFAASKMIKQDATSIKKDLRDFDRRLESINALDEAYYRIRKEKDLGEPETSELYPYIKKRIERANELKKKGRLKDGRKVLNEAYVATKIAIEHLRGGETLVRSLNFESPEEEYHYEVDRNDTHTMLVKILLKEKIDASDRIKNMVDKFMAKSKLLRQEADEQAAQDDYEAAIITIDKSTKEIVRAIRSAGIYIPG